MKTTNKSLSSISLFSGAGGMDLGFKNAGFKVCWSNDLDAKACDTYKSNFSSTNECGPIEEFKRELKSYSDIDCVFGGPPCQGFSVAGKMDLNDPRSKLVYEFMKIVKLIRPKSFVMENVPSLATLEKFRLFRKQLIEEAINCGYSVDLKVISSSLFGIPQERKRMFFVGILGKYYFDLDERIKQFFKNPEATYDAIKDLGIQGTKKNPKTSNAVVTLAQKPILRKSAYAGMLFNGAGRPINPSKPSPTLPASMGGNKTPIIDERLYYHDGYDWVENYHKHLIKGGEPYNMYDVPSTIRRLTIREASRLHGFPDEFNFSGAKTSIYKQIGNAVPPKLAEVIGSIVSNILLGEKYNQSQLTINI